MDHDDISRRVMGPSLRPIESAIIEIARRLDREHLDDVTVHICDTNDDRVRRKQLYGTKLLLSEMLVQAGLTLPREI